MTKGNPLLEGLKGLIPAVFSGSSAQVQTSPADFSRRFLPNNAHVDHGITDTVGYAKHLKAALKHTPDAGLKEILGYIDTYVRQSGPLQQLDQRCMPIVYAGKHQTYPNALVELARTLPDTKAGAEAKRQFLTDYLGISTTLKHHIEEYPYKGATSLRADVPSPVWALRRVFRTLDMEHAQTLVLDLGFMLNRQLPDSHATLQLARMYQDYLANPVVALKADKRQPA